MKLTKRFLFGALSALLLAGCSEDKLGPDSPNSGNDPKDGDGVYMRVNIKMPTATGSRSWTDDPNESNDGTEIGKDPENNINTVYLVLAKASDNTFIGWGEIPASGIEKSTDGTTYRSTASFSKSQLNDFYATIGADESRDVNVFVFCNPTLSLRTTLEEASVANPKSNAWVNATGKYDAKNANAEIIWSDNNFLMSNSALAVRTLPKTMEQWDAFTEASNPFNLSNVNEGLPECDNSVNAASARGPISVERTAARLDFKDGSELGDNTYNVIQSLDEVEMLDGKMGKPYYVNVILNKMSLTNVNKEFYFLRRVSPTGLYDDPATVQICGPELPWFTSTENGLIQNKDGNYVVNVLAPKMLGPISSDFSTYYNYPFFNNAGEIDNPTLSDWYTSEISIVLKGESDNYKEKEYHIWRYCTENTIPGAYNQKNGQSTGIIFKGKIVGSDEALASKDANIAQLARILNNKLNEADKKEFNLPEGLTGYSDQDPIIYKFKGVRSNVGGIFASWQNVQQAAKAGAITPVWESDNTAEGGYWHLEINRSYTLFAAVYGDGSCGSYTFTDSTGKEHTVDDPKTEVDETAPNYFWEKWNAEGRPVPKTGESSSDPKFASYYAFKKAAVEDNKEGYRFTLYQTSFNGTQEGEGEFGYYCYYYYWNRHNDNGQNGSMAPMEFAVVRNNVYKIAVTAINNLGHPRTTSNDPDKPTPNTDDEIDDVYITVDVNVLPWVVRVNNAVF